MTEKKIRKEAGRHGVRNLELTSRFRQKLVDLDEARPSNFNSGLGLGVRETAPFWRLGSMKWAF